MVDQPIYKPGDIVGVMLDDDEYATVRILLVHEDHYEVEEQWDDQHVIGEMYFDEDNTYLISDATTSKSNPGAT